VSKQIHFSDGCTVLDIRYSSRTISLPADLASLGVEGKAVYKLVRTSRLYEQIVQQIEESIVRGNLKPGDQNATWRSALA